MSTVVLKRNTLRTFIRALNIRQGARSYQFGGKSRERIQSNRDSCR